ncbi:Hypothetical protein HVR_LOCUS970 [uncultured virus]|nr:Hypothetical protein HVR_LOCUS970 [uncultured virus]
MMGVFGNVIQAVIPVMGIVGVGCWITKRKIITKENQNMLNQLIFNIFMPCLMVTAVAQVVIIEMIRLLWMLSLPVPLIAELIYNTSLVQEGNREDYAISPVLLYFIVANAITWSCYRR